jgi:hypothetical protein
MLKLLEETLKRAPGFRLHGAHPSEDGWRVIEVWDSKEHANQFFAKHVAPNLPAGVRPKRSMHELHCCLTIER